MNNNFHYNKELRWMPLSTLVIKPANRIYKPRERTDLDASIKESTIIQAFTGLLNEQAVDLLDGFDRRDSLIKSGLPDAVVPVWVITDRLNEAQTKKLILDLGRHKQKGNADYLVEFENYNSIIPSEQGKNLGGHNRHKLIAGLMGISTSKLSQILAINKQKPSLLQEVDNGHRTLTEAEQEAKAIKRQKKDKEEKEESRELGFAKKVDMQEAGETVCPTCKRAFTEMEWKDLPGYFTHGRDETNNQTEWLEPLEEEITNQTNITNDEEE